MSDAWISVGNTPPCPSARGIQAHEADAGDEVRPRGWECARTRSRARRKCLGKYGLVGGAHDGLSPLGLIPCVEAIVKVSP